MAAAPNIAFAEDAEAVIDNAHGEKANNIATLAAVTIPSQSSTPATGHSLTSAIRHERMALYVAPLPAKSPAPIRIPMAVAQERIGHGGEPLAQLSAKVAAAATPAHNGSAAAAAITPIEAVTKPANAPACGPDGCRVRMTPDQLLKVAEKLVAEREFKKAAPLIEALGLAPDYKFQHLFLTGFVQVETGKLKEAEGTFRTLLNANPGQTRIRLELARVLTLRGKEGAANYHYRLAEKDDSLPEDIREAVTGIRTILRSKRNWKLGVDVGFAPDTNINSATSAETVDINFGAFQLPLTLNDEARKTSGIGQTASLNAGLRLRTSKNMALLFDFDSRIVNYAGKVADDLRFSFAAGPQFRISDTASVSLQGFGEQHYYGGRRANTDFGAKLGLQKILNAGQRIDFTLDGRRTNSGFADAYSGWSYGTGATYERVVGKSFIASAGLFARRNDLNADEFSSKSAGASMGIGGELPMGINAGVSGSLSRAVYDAPQFIYSNDKRKDWRMFGRAYAGLRSVRVLGFSPSAEYNFSKTSSNYEINRSTRHRLLFKLARYF